MLLSLPLLLTVTAPARAQERVDASLGVWLAPADTVAMGGAGIGLATGATGLYLLPAAAAARRSDQTRTFSPTGTIGLMRVGARGAVDMGNTGLEEAEWDGLAGNLGGGLIYGDLGVGVVARVLRYEDGEGQQVSLYQGHSGLASRLLGGQLIVGAGLAPLVLDAGLSDVESTWWGMGAEVGALIAASSTGLSGGVGWRSQVSAAADEGELKGTNEAVMPPQLSLGVAWASREATSWMRHVRGVADVVITGRVEEAVALEPLIHGEVVPKGGQVTATPKLGVECEVWPDRVKLRAGTYYEAARTTAAPSRLHTTGGAELRLLHVEGVWGLLDHDVSWAFSADVADRYNNLGYLSFRFWRPTTLLVD